MNRNAVFRALLAEQTRASFALAHSSASPDSRQLVLDGVEVGGTEEA